MTRPDLSGDTIGEHFLLQSRLGSGHFGDVYLCQNMMLARESALKVVKINQENSSTAILEAQLLNISQHAHIVKVLSAAEWIDKNGSQNLLIEMEYVPGGILEDAIKNEISVGDIIAIMKNVLFALDHAHPDVIHRDVKPANILLGGGGKLSDFGIAMVASTGLSASNFQYFFNKAPECFPPYNKYSASTDVYSAGLTMFRELNIISDWRDELFLKFGDGQGVIARMQAGTLIDGLGFHPRVPDPLKRIVKKACSKDPSRRYPSAAVFRDALESLNFVRDWKRKSGDAWIALSKNLEEEISISSVGGMFEVNFLRNGRRKSKYKKLFKIRSDAEDYCYQLMANLTLA